MPDSTEATPRPWRCVEEEWEGTPHISSDANEHIVCHGHNYDDYGGMSKADATLIVAAVNAYDRLKRIEQQAARLVIWIDGGGQPGPWPNASGLNELRIALQLNELRTALETAND